MLTVNDIRTVFPAILPLTEYNIALAEQALDFLWHERQKERGYLVTPERSGSCKFAALLARELFGGQLAGNLDHVFVILSDGAVLDLNRHQPDVVYLGEKAHFSFGRALHHYEYRQALSSCVPRVNKWKNWVLSQIDIQKTA